MAVPRRHSVSQAKIGLLLHKRGVGNQAIIVATIPRMPVISIVHDVLEEGRWAGDER